MPATTDDGLAAEKALDSKLEAIYASETGGSGPDEGTPAPVDAPEAAVETLPAEEPAEPAVAADGEDPEVAALLEKYGGDQQKALRAAVDAQKLIGKQGNELGEYRREFEERIADVQVQAQAQIQAIQAQQQQQHYTAQAPASINVALEQGNYFAAAETARQTNDPVLINHVMTQWFADPDQAFGAQQYDKWLTQQELRAEFSQLLDERLGGITDNVQPLMRQQEQAEFTQEFAEFAAARPDVQQLAPTMMQVAQDQGEDLQKRWSEGGVRGRAAIMKELYYEARDRVGDTLATAAATAATQAAEAAHTAKTQATVGSPSTQSQAKTLTKNQQIKAELREILFDNPTSIARGLVRGE